MHIVHIKEEYNSSDQAEKDPSGIAVLGFMFQVILLVYLAMSDIRTTVD